MLNCGEWWWVVDQGRQQDKCMVVVSCISQEVDMHGDAYMAGTVRGSGVDVELRWWPSKQVDGRVYISGVGR